MKNNIELIIGVCVTKTDFDKYRNRLFQSLKNLYSAFKTNCVVYIVLQSDSACEISEGFYGEEWIKLVNIHYMGISNARNLCIEKAQSISAKYIIFHDASLYWTPSAAEFIFKYKEHPVTPCVNISFEDHVEPHICRGLTKHTNVMSSKITKNNPIYNSFVWSYLFRVADINSSRFDLNFGPGDSTIFKSGEDVLFLFEYFSKDKRVIMPRNSGVLISHPPRPGDFSKHLLYAYGQGALFRKLVKEHFNIRLLIDVVLFFGNAIFRCIMLRKNAFPILINRLKGFTGV